MTTVVTLPHLFIRFLHLGATAYGGPAMMAYLRQQTVKRDCWLSDQEFQEGMALCQVIPGATMVQMATYVGYRLRGLPGATVAAIAFVLPACALMTALSAAYVAFGELHAVQAIFRGLAAVVVAIILHACMNLARPILTSWHAAVLTALAIVALLLGVHIILVLFGAALLALLVLPLAPASGPGGRR